MVVIDSGGLMVMLSACEALCGGLLESVTFTVKLEVPAVVAVPEITPVLLFKLRPAGNVPVVMLHVTGGVPPLDCKVWL